MDADRGHCAGWQRHCDRVTILPTAWIDIAQAQLLRLKKRRIKTWPSGRGSALPFALARKYPNADREWGWQYVFPSARLALDAETGEMRRWYMSPSTLQKAVRQAAKAAGIAKPVGPHTFRHYFATHLLENHYDIHTVQELLGHKDVRTSMIYTHVLQRGGLAVRSPLD